MSARRGSDMTLLMSAGKKDGSSLFNMGEAMIRLHLILICSVPLWFDSVTAGIIIARASPTKPQRHRETEIEEPVIARLAFSAFLFSIALIKTQTPLREIRRLYFVCKIKKFISKL
jgi:hypothetical protein